MRPARNLVVLSVLVFTVACGTPKSTPSSDRGGLSASTQATHGDESFPFEPTYLPDGFTNEPISGPAPKSRRPDSKRQVIVHYRGPGAAAIEIRKPGTLFVELAQANDAPTIDVLGSETSAFGPVEPYGNEFIVLFTYPSDSSSRDDCALYSLNEYGVPLPELLRVAEGLRTS